MDPPIKNNLAQQLALWDADKTASKRQGFSPHTRARASEDGAAVAERR